MKTDNSEKDQMEKGVWGDYSVSGESPVWDNLVYVGVRSSGPNENLQNDRERHKSERRMSTDAD